MNALPITASFVLAINIIIIAVSSQIDPLSVCGPHTRHVLVIKNGIICGTIAEQPSMRHMSVDPQVITKIRKITKHDDEDPMDSSYTVEPINRRPDIEEDGVAKYHRLLFEKLTAAKKFPKKLGIPKQQTHSDLRIIDQHYNNDNNNHKNTDRNNYSGDFLSDDQQQQAYTANSELSIIENFVKSLQQHQQIIHNDNLAHHKHNNQFSGDSVEQNNNGIDGQIDSIWDPNKVYEQLRQQNEASHKFSDNNGPERERSLISGVMGNGVGFGTRLRHPTVLNYQTQAIREPVSQTQIHHQIVAQSDTNNRFGFPKSALIKPQITQHLYPTYRESKAVPNLLYGFRPIGGEVQPPKRESKHIGSDDYWTTVKPGLKYKSLVTVGSSLPVSEEIYKNLDDISTPVPEFQPQINQDLVQNYYYNLNNDGEELKQPEVDTSIVYGKEYETSNSKNNLDMHSSASDKYVFASEPKDFYLDKSRVEYYGWKPIGINREDKSLKRNSFDGEYDSNSDNNNNNNYDSQSTVMYSLVRDYYNTTDSRARK